MAEPFIRLEVRGAAAEGQLAKDFDRAQRRIQNRLNREMRQMQREIPLIYKAEAPSDTGALERSIKGTLFMRGRAIRLTVAGDADARGSGFDYLAVTRFGHRQATLRARGPSRRFGRPKLMTVHLQGRGGSPTLRKTVKGYRPRVDWVNIADRAALAKVDREYRDIDRSITAILTAMARGR